MITKPKNRYILVESSVPLEGRGRTYDSAILGGVAAEIGSLGFVKANPRIVRWIGDNRFIIRSNRGTERDIVLALSFIKRINGRDLGFYTIQTSGTIKKLGSVRRRPGSSAKVA